MTNKPIKLPASALFAIGQVLVEKLQPEAVTDRESFNRALELAELLFRVALKEDPTIEYPHAHAIALLVGIPTAGPKGRVTEALLCAVESTYLNGRTYAEVDQLAWEEVSQILEAEAR